LLFGLNIETAFSLSGLNCNSWCMAEEITIQIKSNKQTPEITCDDFFVSLTPEVIEW